MKEFTLEQFMSFYGTSGPARQAYELIRQALEMAGIYSPLVLIGALATVRTEVGKSYMPIEEKSSGEQYEGRKVLGNTQKGDGKRYKGRGYIQITGRYNYNYYSHKLGVDLVTHPEYALEPEYAAIILAEYFKDRKIDKACNERNWIKVRKLVNGGTNGLETFQSVVAQFLVKAGI